MSHRRSIARWQRWTAKVAHGRASCIQFRTDQLAGLFHGISRTKQSIYRSTRMFHWHTFTIGISRYMPIASQNGSMMKVKSSASGNFAKAVHPHWALTPNRIMAPSTITIMGCSNSLPGESSWEIWEEKLRFGEDETHVEGYPVHARQNQKRNDGCIFKFKLYNLLVRSFTIYPPN